MAQTNTAPIINPAIHIKPSKKLRSYISKLNVYDDLPAGISNTLLKDKPKKHNIPPLRIDHLINEDDQVYITSVSEGAKKDIFTEWPLTETSNISSTDRLLGLEDIYWLYTHMSKENNDVDKKVYLHEILEGSEIVLPKNEEIPRNEELDRRCKQLQAEQANQAYFNMTKNVDNKRKVHPEDTIGYQLQQMNRHMVAIFQFVVSVAAGFAFGFTGVEVIIGSLDFGFRLLLGIICALTVALAELYFLAKKLSEDLQFEYTAEQNNRKGIKLD